MHLLYVTEAGRSLERIVQVTIGVSISMNGALALSINAARIANDVYVVDLPHTPEDYPQKIQSCALKVNEIITVGDWE